jgi:hypothetical protein
VILGVAIVIGALVLGLAVVLAAHRAVQAALAAQVRNAELRVEATKREDVAAIAAQVRTLASRLDSFETAAALGRRR